MVFERKQCGEKCSVVFILFVDLKLNKYINFVFDKEGTGSKEVLAIQCKVYKTFIKGY